MDTAGLVTLWSDNRLLSIAAWAVIAVVLLYLARQHAHAAIRAAALMLVTQARRLSRAARHGSDALAGRARRALLQLAREATERAISHRTYRLGATLSRDLASFPHLHRQVHEQIRRIDEDYRRTVESPPTPPEWLDAIESVARLPARDDPAIGRMLEDMHATLDRACHESMLAYRAAGRRRHRVLRRMQPLWRRMDSSLSSLENALERIQNQSDRIDEQIADYADILARKAGVVRRLAANLTVRVLLSVLFLAAVAVAAVVDFTLIARPLAEIGAGSGSVAGVPFNQVMSGMVVALLALTGGILLDTARITHLFPATHWVDDRPRLVIATLAALLLGALLAATSALAWTRDYLVTLEATAGRFPTELAANGLPSAAFQWIPAITHSLLALGLGLVVAVTVLPLETLLRQGRILCLGALALILRGVALAMDLAARFIGQLRRLLVAVYDLVIFLPLATERAVHTALGRRREVAGPAPPHRDPDTAASAAPPRDDSASTHGG